MIERLPLVMWPRVSGGVLAILIYHRVLPIPDRLFPGEIDAQRFAHQMRFLAKNFCVLPLREAALRLRAGTLPKRSCCITFDDGYADNLTIATPILEQFGLPATVFVASEYLDGGLMFNDAVLAIARSTQLAVLDLTPLGLGRWPLATDEDRRAMVAALLSQLKYVAPQDRARRVADLVAAAQCPALPTDLMLTTPQLAQLSQRGVEIGGHTHSHAILTTLDLAQVKAEIERNQQLIFAATGKPVRVFAYPNGGPNRDYGRAHAQLLATLDIEAAVTTAAGVANQRSDPYQLPRFTPWDRAMPRFAARLMLNARLGRPVATAD